MSIGEKIHQLRKAAGLTQEQLAEKLDVSRQTISKWEIGSCLPDLDKAIQLSKIFAISLDEMVREDIEGVQKYSEQLTVEDIIRINNHNRKMMLLATSGAAFLILGVLSFIVISITDSATVSLEYMLYRYIAVGEYTYAPADYSTCYIAAIICGIAGISLLIIYILKQKRKS